MVQIPTDLSCVCKNLVSWSLPALWRSFSMFRWKSDLGLSKDGSGGVSGVWRFQEESMSSSVMIRRQIPHCRKLQSLPWRGSFLHKALHLPPQLGWNAPEQYGHLHIYQLRRPFPNYRNIHLNCAGLIRVWYQRRWSNWMLGASTVEHLDVGLSSFPLFRRGSAVWQYRDVYDYHLWIAMGGTPFLVLNEYFFELNPRKNPVWNIFLNWIQEKNQFWIIFLNWISS